MNYWVRPFLVAMVVISLSLGAFNNCQNIQGSSGAFVAGASPIEDEVCREELRYFYSPSTQLSMFAADTCEARVLKSQGYVEVSESFAAAVQIDGDSLMWVDLKAPPAESLCTMEFAVMIHPDLGLCANAHSGCEIDYAEFLGFEKDVEQNCPPRPTE